MDRVSLCSRGEGGVSARCGRVSSCSRAESVVLCNGRVVSSSGRASSGCKRMSLGYERVSLYSLMLVLFSSCRKLLEEPEVE